MRPSQFFSAASQSPQSLERHLSVFDEASQQLRWRMCVTTYSARGGQRAHAYFCCVGVCRWRQMARVLCVVPCQKEMQSVLHTKFAHHRVIFELSCIVFLARAAVGGGSRSNVQAALPGRQPPRKCWRSCSCCVLLFAVQTPPCNAV